MRIVSAADIHRVLDYPSLIETLRDSFRAGCEVPPRHHHTVAAGKGDRDATLLLMPAWQSGGGLGVKIVTVFPENAVRSLPAVFGTYVLLDGATGAPAAVLDGTALTLRRTAAASALAADYLARSDAAIHLMVGTGALAPHLCAAHAAIRPIRRTLVWGRDCANAELLARHLREQGLAADAIADLQPAAAAADIITCATLSADPLIRGEWLQPGVHLDLVGGYTPAMRETDDAAIIRAAVYIDTEAATREAGDIVQPLRAGRLARDTIAGDLFGLTRGTCRGRRSARQITLFKSVRTALEDLAAAQLAVSRVSA